MPRSRCSAWTRRPMVADQLAGARELIEFVDLAAQRRRSGSSSPDFIVEWVGPRPVARTRGMQQQSCPAEPGASYTRRMLVLGIESSCDETGVALVESGRAAAVPRLAAHALHSQIAMHQAYGGVVPELASRDHIRRVLPLAQQVLSEAGRAAGRCRRGRLHARARGWRARCWWAPAWPARSARRCGKPVLGVHHLEGHLAVAVPERRPARISFRRAAGVRRPHAADAGGRRGRYELLGETIDDAAGEAFDKSAKLMGLPYPGGPWLAKLAEQGDPAAFKLPRPLLHSGDLDFSFAGLKTAVLTQAKKLGDQLEARKADLAASTQAGHRRGAAEEIAARARAEPGSSAWWWPAGWAPTAMLRQQLDAACAKRGVRVHYPELHLCTDNGAMIAMAAAMRLQAGLQAPTEALRLRRQAAMATGVAGCSAGAASCGSVPAAAVRRRSGSTSSILRQSCDHCGQSWPPSVVNTWPGGSASASRRWLEAKRSPSPKPRYSGGSCAGRLRRRRTAAARARACGRPPRPAAAPRAPSRRAGRRPCGSRRRAGAAPGRAPGRRCRRPAPELGQFVDQGAEAADRDADQPDRPVAQRALRLPARRAAAAR